MYTLHRKLTFIVQVKTLGIAVILKWSKMLKEINYSKVTMIYVIAKCL